MMISEKLIALWNSSRCDQQKDFATLHHILYPKLFIYSVRMLQDAELVNDLLQDLFIKFWQNRKKIGPLRNVEGYFYRATRSAVLNQIRQQNHRTSKLSLAYVINIEFSIEEIIVANEANSELKHAMFVALNSLPPKQKEILKMRFYDDISYPQIASILGIRYQSVINHVYRATQSLRQLSDLSDVYAA